MAIILLVINITGFSLLFYQKRTQAFLWVAIMFLTFVIDVALILASEIFPSLGDFLMSSTRGHFLYTTLYLFILFSYRKFTTCTFNKKISTTEYVVIAAVVLVIFSSFYVLGEYEFEIFSTLITRIIFYCIWIQGFIWLKVSQPAWGQRIYRFLFSVIVFALVTMTPDFIIDIISVFIGSMDYLVTYRNILVEVFSIGFTIFGFLFLYHYTKSEALLIKITNKYSLTRREAEILGLLIEGFSNNEIAQRLFISYGTAKIHVHKIFRKLGIKHRNEISQIVSKTHKNQ